MVVSLEKPNPIRTMNVLQELLKIRYRNIEKRKEPDIMGWWDYKNIGASTSRLNKHLVAKIFEYMGYCSRPDYAADGEDCSFSEPDVYCCMSSVYNGPRESDQG